MCLLDKFWISPVSNHYSDSFAFSHTYRFFQQMEPVVEMVNESKRIRDVVSFWAEDQHYCQRDVFCAADQTKNSIGWIHNYRFDRTVWFMPVLPVCVKSFGHSSSGNVEPLLWVRDPGKRTDPLHLPPAQLLHPLSLLLLQRRSQQVPQRSAAQTKDQQTLTFEYWEPVVRKVTF